MKCQKCDGEGRTLLFTSVRPCEACDGTGRVTPITTKASKTNLPQSQTSHNTTVMGTGGSINITEGTFKFDDRPDSLSPKTLFPSPYAGGHCLSLDVTPFMDGIAAPAGSLVLGSSSAAPLIRPMGLESEGPDIRDALAELVVKTISTYEKWKENNETWKHREKAWTEFNLIEVFTSLFPVSKDTLADMMGVLEQEGEEVLAFISSSRDFADIRKFDNGKGISWEGQQVSFFGIPFLHSHKIPAGYMAAVSTGHKLVFCTITR